MHELDVAPGHEAESRQFTDECFRLDLLVGHRLDRQHSDVHSAPLRMQSHRRSQKPRACDHAQRTPALHCAYLLETMRGAIS